MIGIWTNGYWIDGAGEIYSFDYDFGALAEEDIWEDRIEGYSPADLPGCYYLARTETGWNTAVLPVAEDPQTPEGISAQLQELDGSSLTISIANNSGAEWNYGKSYRLQAFLDDGVWVGDGAWYELPPKGTLSWEDVAYLLSDGESASMTYALTPYGDLLDGLYRLVTDDGLCVEFRIGESTESAETAESEETNVTNAENRDVSESKTGISAVVTGQDDTSVTVTYTNQSGAEWDCGVSYRLMVPDGDSWNEVPMTSDYAWEDTLDCLPDGESVTRTYDLTLFGQLSNGQYRLVLEDGASVEFRI